ncbi:ANTAR domain-containing protein [Streptomyces sp. NPDC092369]|uniref:ANTAR domain-containing protein n=1 Tax=Streptomyces sp. NPDC092369 TaxID=3366015 RepID=UPI0038039E4E
MVDQAIGVLSVLGPLAPAEGFIALREISQHTNTRPIHIAEQVLKHGQGAALPTVLQTELQAALARHTTPPAGGSTERKPSQRRRSR